jgi:outer membrane protein insertion porin family
MVAICVLFSGCLGTQYLKEGEYILYKQKFNGVENLSEEQLRNILKQEPNRRMPILPIAPYVGFYQFGLQHYDTAKVYQKIEKVKQKYRRKIANHEGKEKKIAKLQAREDKKLAHFNRKLEEGNLWMRWGEPLAIYDHQLTQESLDQLNQYLQTKGFFNGTVTYDTTFRQKLVTVTYEVNEGAPYTIDPISYVPSDTAIWQLINKHADQSLLRKDENYDQSVITAERIRIDELLKNNGYFDFSRQYITIRVDSTLDNQQVGIKVIIQTPEDRLTHKVFGIDSVIFTTDANVQGFTGDRQISVFDSITYRYYKKKYSRKILNKRLFIRSNTLYSKQSTLETQRQLSNLDMFKFINVNYDTTGGKTIANIYTSPLKKFQTSTEVGLNVSQVGQIIPGPFVNASLKTRNPFGGLEILELSGRAGIEGVPSVLEPGQPFKSREVSASLALTFPHFLFPFSGKLRIGNLNPKTTLQTGYNFASTVDYERANLKTSITYNWQKAQKVSYTLTPIDINVIDSKINTEKFQNFLDSLRNIGSYSLPRAFDPSFVTSSIFTTIFNFNNYGTDNLKASYLKVFAESGGLLYNFFGTAILDSLDLAYFKFVKLNTDYRQYVPLSQHTIFAYRFNLGVAVPYGGQAGLPYEKYFFAGGSSSIRAWPPRRLGPGSFRPTHTKSDGYIDYQVEQPGEILLETSIEIRRNILGVIEGAFFLDAGNTWLVEEDPARPNGDFALNRFYKEIALGTGLGLRLDFSYLIARFDFGLKLYDPARGKGERWIGQEFTVGEELQNFTFNLGIGYPF